MIDNDYKSSYVVTGHQERKKKNNEGSICERM